MRTIVPDVPEGVLSAAWRECVGTGRFALALRRDYQDSLALVQSEIGFRYIRGHGLLSDDVGIVRPYEYAGARHTRYAYSYVDQVIDAYLDLGIRPFIELGFMPRALASGKETVFWWHGNITPPSSYAEWGALVKTTVRHLVERYGIEEVRTWPIEVWNEPNLTMFWVDADEAAYHRLYETSALAIKEVDASLQVGGPAISPGADEWMPRFAEFVTARDVPCDFVSRHAYSSGPAEHVPFGSHQTIKPPADLLEQFATPRAQLRGTPLAGSPVHITEFNTSYCPDNPIHDTAYNAAYLAPVLAHGGDHVDSFSYWTFSDMFEEAGIPTTLFHGGFGLLTHRQIRKPTYHLYAFFARLGPSVLARGDHHLVTRFDDGRLALVAWAPLDVDTHTLALSLPVGGASAYVARSIVNESAGNAWAAWGEMGRPPSPTRRELALLQEASAPVRTHRRAEVNHGRVELDLVLGRHEVTLVEVSPVTDSTPPWWDERRLLGGSGADGA